MMKIYMTRQQSQKTIDEPIGALEIVSIIPSYSIGEIGYCFGKKFWNQGYATEALTAVIEFMFDIVGIEKLSARHSYLNPASGKVMINSGMTFDGILKDYGKDKSTGNRVDRKQS